MSDYEFWKELGKIFNAVVSYQEKSIEFNKQFINPWIKIGNVFDQQDRQQEEVRAYTQAAEMDSFNPQCWIDLGNAHYRNQSHDEAVIAFQKAIELDPKLGWPYSNLAVIYAEQNKHAEAKALYEKSIQLLKDDREKATSWNRLGNLHRKLNEYELAIQAFQKADELDRENAGLMDVMSESRGQSQTQIDEPTQIDAIATSIQLIVAQGQSDEDARDFMEGSARVQTEDVSLATEPLSQPEPTSVTETVANAIPEAASSMASTGETVSHVEATSSLYVEADATSASVEASAPTETEALSHQSETYSAEMTPDQQIEIKTSDSTAMVSVVQETTVTPPSPQKDLPETSMDIRDVEPLESIIPVAIEEPTTEILFDANSSNVITEPTNPITVAEESIATITEVTNPVEAIAEPVEPVIAVVNEEPASEIAIVANAPEGVAEAADHNATVTIEGLIAETNEAANPVEAVAEPVEPVAAVSIDEPASEIAIVANAPEDVAEAADHNATVTIEGLIAEINEAANPVEVVAEPVEPVIAVVNEEPIAETNEAANPVEAVVETVEPIETIALEEPIVEADTEYANSSETATEAAEPITFAETEISAPENADEADSSETANGVGLLAYDEFLKDENQRHASISVQVSPERPEQEIAADRKPLALIDESGDFKLEMDTKNAHVWNELGNVYFNKGAVEDAVIAYSKAIELDRLFAWPYSNLALAYVQKGRFAEATLLYQRSIELFTNNKDKAISWNRLGNVYRRLNDYDNAIAAYQRADVLDPDNSTIHLQSRFSLLGSIQMNQNANAEI